ncbi:MAG: type II toxin-antitoxin system Phd/YefM family antitoxin [Candidatus Binatia bacterium]
MKTAPVTELKNHLSRYLRMVASGESVTITDHGQPVARLSRVDSGSSDADALVAAGLARPPLAPLPPDFLERRLPKGEGRSAVIEDREDRF